MRVVSQSEIQIWVVAAMHCGKVPRMLGLYPLDASSIAWLALEGAPRQDVLLNKCLQKVSPGRELKLGLLNMASASHITSRHHI